MSKQRYSSEEAYRILTMSSESEGEDSLAEPGSEYEPIDSSGTLTASSDDEEVVPAKVAEVVQMHDDSHMQQSASTSAAVSFGELASTSGLVRPGRRHTSTAVSLANLNTPLNCFELFFTEDLYALIVDQSNLYARQFIAANPNSNLARPFAW
ncbi:unnamed protein product, partial [Staurois parvus]